MQGFNHVAGGVVFTGVFASITNTNIFEKPEYVALTVFCAVLPDIDHTKSIIGKTFYPLAKYLNTHYGHRTITHSIFFWLISVLLVYAIEIYFSLNHDRSTIVLYGIISHDIFDMCTKAGVPFFYPVSKRTCVLPANPHMRLSSTDYRTEAMIFILFLSLGIFCKPLFAQGFWTTYSRALISYGQVRKEMNRKNDLMNVTFVDEKKDTVRGIIVSHEDENLIVWNSKEFREFKPKDLEFIDFQHTGKKAIIQEVSLKDVEPDSLKVVLKNRILKGEITSNQSFGFMENAILRTTNDYKFLYKSNPEIFINPTDTISKIAEIKMLEIQSKEELKPYLTAINELKKLNEELTNGWANYSKLSEFEKGKWIEKSKNLKAEIKELSKTETPNQSDNYLKIQQLKQDLERQKVKMSANLLIWKFDEPRIKAVKLDGW